MNRRLLISLSIVAGGYGLFWLLHAGFHSAPTTVRGADLGDLQSVVSCSGETHPVAATLPPQWKIQTFAQVTSPSKLPPAANSCRFKVTTTTGTYQGLYTPAAARATFNFSPRYTHGWFVKPATGNAPGPLYTAKVPPWLQSALKLPPVPNTAARVSP